MQKISKHFVFLGVAATLLFVLAGISKAEALNGDLMMGIGPIARTMGGTGIAASQDIVSSVYSNPATLCFNFDCNETPIEFSSTFLAPGVDAEISIGNNVYSATGKDKTFVIPAIGLVIPLKDPAWRLGLALYGAAGVGVDYRNTAIDRNNYFDLSALYGYPQGTVTLPLAKGLFVNHQVTRFSPALVYKVNANLSLGIAIHANYGILDLGEGSKSGTGIGAQLGAVYKIIPSVSAGLTYTTTQAIDFKDVMDFDGNNIPDSLKVATPQSIGIGLAISPIKDRLLLEADIKWLNWSKASGYDAFGFRNQWVLGIGTQYKPTEKLSVRFGYNYGRNPVNPHEGFNGSSYTDIQGKSLPTYFYETFRIVGLPVIVEHHIGIGASYEVTKKLTAHLGYAHGFKNTLSESGTDITGNPVALKSSAGGDSLELGVKWIF